MRSDPEPAENFPPQTLLAPPGPNALFFAVLAGLLLGILAGACAGEGAPSAALNSNLVFRIEVGLIGAAVSYWAAAALWLAWHQTLFQKFGLGHAQTETPEHRDDVTERDKKFAAFMEETTEAVTKLEDRVDALSRTRIQKPEQRVCLSYPDSSG